MTNRHQNRPGSGRPSKSPLPKQYQWLGSLTPLPLMLREALSLFGTVEAGGRANSPKIIGWAREVGGDVAEAYKADAIPWCGLFLAVAAKRAGKTPPMAPLWALNWMKFGVEAGQPALGDVLVFLRKAAVTSRSMSARTSLPITCWAETSATASASRASPRSASDPPGGRFTGSGQPR